METSVLAQKYRRAGQACVTWKNGSLNSHTIHDHISGCFVLLYTNSNLAGWKQLVDWEWLQLRCSHGAHSFLKLHPIWGVISEYSLLSIFFDASPFVVLVVEHQVIAGKTHAFLGLYRSSSTASTEIPSYPGKRVWVKMWMSPNGFEN